jgi:MoaA/NifB/PqqE/SkfB family radical SAM enzyme
MNDDRNNKNLSDNSSLFKEYTTLQHRSPEHGDYVVINWCIGNTCNYKCSYCPKELHNGSSPWPAIEEVIDFCKKVIKHYRGKKLYFEFTGGEVTLWKELPDLLHYLHNEGCKVGIISNGSKSEQFWSQFIDKIDHVCLSFHPETGREEHFLNIVKLCADKVRTHVNFMMHPEHFARCLALAYKVKDVENISIAIQPLVEDFKDQLYPYTETQRKIISQQNSYLAKQIQYTKPYSYYRGAMQMVTASGQKVAISPQRFISSQNNSWKGWDCSAGLEQIVIDFNGNIYRGWCQVGGTLGKVGDEKLSLPTRTIRCNKDYCHCNLDIMTTKKKPGIENESSYLNPWTRLKKIFSRRGAQA